jgi:hypothetical protein
MANPPTRTPATPATSQRQLPDHVTSPGLSKMVAAHLEDYHERLQHEHAEQGTSRTVQVTLDILRQAAQQLGSLHGSAAED